MNRPLAIVALSLAASLAGCAATQTAAESPTGVPEPFEVTLQVKQADGRFAYYELHRDRMLRFGGGRDANIRQAYPIGKLTDEQARSVWQIIDRHKLLDASGQLFPDYTTVRYQFAATAAGDGNSITTVDDHVPGLAELDKRLFELQADMRYGDLYGPIDERVRKSGGAVPKQ